MLGLLRRPSGVLHPAGCNPFLPTQHCLGGVYGVGVLTAIRPLRPAAADKVQGRAHDRHLAMNIPACSGLQFQTRNQHEGLCYLQLTSPTYEPYTMRACVTYGINSQTPQIMLQRGATPSALCITQTLPGMLCCHSGCNAQVRLNGTNYGTASQTFCTAAQALQSSNHHAAASCITVLPLVVQPGAERQAIMHSVHQDAAYTQLPACSRRCLQAASLLRNAAYKLPVCC